MPRRQLQRRALLWLLAFSQCRAPASEAQPRAIPLPAPAAPRASAHRAAPGSKIAAQTEGAERASKAEHRPQTQPHAALRSPRLRSLRLRLRDDPGALDAFWAEIAREHTPLIEPLAGGRFLVTFLWRADPDTHRVLAGWPAWTYAFADCELRRLPGSDVFWRSLELPRGTRMSYQLMPDPKPPAGASKPELDRAIEAVAQADPLNPLRLLPRASDAPNAQRSILVVPGAAPETWLDDALPAADSTLERTTWHSRILHNRRTLGIYRPERLEPSRSYPLLVFFDGEGYMREMAAVRLLDHLIAARRVRPLIAVFVTNATADSRNRELPCNPRFARALARELLPWLRARYPISDDPSQIGLAGSSFGGLAAACAAYAYPHTFGAVLSQSGSFWWGSLAGNAQHTPGEGLLTRRFEHSPRLPLRFYMSAGLFERGTHGEGILEHNRALAALLREKGYPVTQHEFAGGHDPLAWRADLPDGLTALFGP